MVCPFVPPPSGSKKAPPATPCSSLEFSLYKALLFWLRNPTKRPPPVKWGEPPLPRLPSKNAPARQIQFREYRRDGLPAAPPINREIRLVHRINSGIPDDFTQTSEKCSKCFQI